ncbi:MAG: hypothetical protein BMS9Abin36_0437 [Gammaproteobacteria bacterium]|nr:MAG: hypothetical protein BMS9Abin36_0437 [Gammaproteobacteria bacterium]
MTVIAVDPGEQLVVPDLVAGECVPGICRRGAGLAWIIGLILVLAGIFWEW